MLQDTERLEMMINYYISIGTLEELVSDAVVVIAVAAVAAVSVVAIILSTIAENDPAADEVGNASRNDMPFSHASIMLGSMGSFPK